VLGLYVGSAEGEMVGETVGVSVVGFLEGEVLGWYVGSEEGETVGVSVVGF